MRQIFFLVLLFITTGLFAQAPANYTNINGRYRWIAGMFDSTFHIPKGTTTSLRTGGSTNAGALFYRTTDSSVYYYTGTQWLKVAGAAGFVPYTGATQNVDLGQFGLKTKYVQFDTSSQAVTDRRLQWSNAEGTLQFGMTNGATITQRVGLEQFARVRNLQGDTIEAGDVVYISGASGDRAAVKLADNRADSTSSKTLGVATEQILPNDVGLVGTFGVVGKLNLSAFTAGDVVYLDSIPGKLTKVKPQAPYHMVFVGVVERANAGNGLLFVNVQNGYELEELHNVRITSPVRNNGILAYDSVGRLWKDTTLNALGGITGSGTSGQVSYFNGTNSITSSPTFAFTPTSQLLVNNSVTASGAIARGINATPSLTAAANNDVLVGLDINPTFSNGAFTGVTNYAARFQNDILVQKSQNAQAVINTTSTGSATILRLQNNGNNIGGLTGTGSTFGYGTYAQNQTNLTGGSGGIGIRTNNSAAIRFYATNADADFSTVQMQMFASTGNVTLQNGGTFTDAGFRLDVNGTARVQDNFTVSRNQNLATTITLSNTNSNAASVAGVNVTSSNGTISFAKYSATTTPYKIVSAGDGYISNGSADIAILNDFATGAIKMAAGGSSTAQLTIAANGTLTSNAAATASGAIARGVNVTSSLTAAANNDVLVGLDINPTFTNGAFTGVQNYAARFQNANVLLSFNQNNGTNYIVSNTTLGSASSARLLLTSDASSGQAIIGKYSTGLTTYKTLVGKDALIYNDATGGDISILNDFATGAIKMAAGGSSTAQLTLDANGDLRSSVNKNNTTLFSITNTTAGTNTQAQISLITDIGSLQLGKYASTKTAYKTITSSSAYVYNNTSGGNISILNDFASGNINFAAGGVSTAQATLFSTGNFALNTTTDAGFRLDIAGTARVQTSLQVGNFTVGVNNTAKINTDGVIRASGGFNARDATGNDNIFTGIKGSGNTVIVTSGNNDILQLLNVGSAASGSYLNFINSANPSTGTGTVNLINLNTSIVPTGNNSIAYNYIHVSGNITQGAFTGGTITGFLYNPSLTSLTSVHRAIQTVTGDVIFGSTSGNVMIGTFTAGGRFTIQPTNNQVGMAISGSSLTGSNAQSLVSLSQTWNTTGNPTAIKLDVTNTASGNNSYLLDLQVGGIPQFTVFKGGEIKTSSPAGGVAQTWKLGSVHAVTPTSPDRTIEVEVNGTTYYIHAKTTNN